MTPEEIITDVMAGRSAEGLCASCKKPVASKGMCRAHYQKAYRWLTANGMTLERAYTFRLAYDKRTPAAEAKGQLWAAIQAGEAVGN